MVRKSRWYSYADLGTASKRLYGNQIELVMKCRNIESSPLDNIVSASKLRSEDPKKNIIPASPVSLEPNLLPGFLDTGDEERDGKYEGECDSGAVVSDCCSCFFFL